ncbi:MAG: hypothetical protein M1115_05215 [Actinobacteria bacterium]|jgi:hypothetical protein|nr:hypothetical protein [Actinomycetota bacterium]
MEPPIAELSSISATLDEITKRVGALALQAADQGAEELAGDLFSIERALGGAGRRMAKLVSSGHKR